MKKSPSSLFPPCPSVLAAAAAALLFTAGSAPATVTLQFSTASIYATNWANAAGAGGSTLVWGIIVDTAGNGFEDFYSSSGVTFTGATGQSLHVGTTGAPGPLTDDYLFLSPNAMSLTNSSGTDATVSGMNRITSIANIPYGTAGIGSGDAFRLVWFDRTVLNGNSPSFLEKFGFFGDASFVIPPDGNTQPFTSIFVGADPLKPMNTHFDITPEPSSALLGLLGAVGLLRRRRC